MYVNDRNFSYTRKIGRLEVNDAMKNMRIGKACGPNSIPIELESAVEWLTKIFNAVLWICRMPNDWRKSTMVLIYKNKRDIQSYANYCGI